MRFRSTMLAWFITVLLAIGLAGCRVENASSAQDQNSSPEQATLDADASTPSPQSGAPFGRLPATASLLYYTLDMIVDPREEWFSAQAAIEVDLLEATDGLWLHGKDLTVDAVTISQGDQELSASWSDVLPTGVARIDFGQMLDQGQVTITIDYQARFDDRLRGLFRVDEQGDAYALAKSESIQARRFLPGFDEPAYKAPYKISLTIPEDYEAISNGPEVARTPSQAGFTRIEFAETRPLPTFLLSVAVGPFDIVEYAPLPPNTVRSWPIPLRGVARRGRGGDLDYALSVTADLIEIFETELGVPYPYQKLDIVAAPQWPSGATELAGAITYRESRILYNSILGETARRSLLGIHTHEIAHMWFGDLVTPPWWDDLWLKESFATWGTPFSLIEFEPNGKHDLDALTRSLSAMRLDSIASARAIREPITRNEDVRNAYDGITYSKGMAVIHMIDQYFGPDLFRPALGEYIKLFEDGTADAPQFFEVIGDVSGEPDLTDVFGSFVTQSGLPRLDVSIDCTNTPMLTLSQSQYAPLGSSIVQGKSWVLPACVVLGDETGGWSKACTVLRSEEATLELKQQSCPAYIMPNAGGTGYYRWDLEPEQWSALAVNFSSLPATEALSALDSANAALRAGGGDASGLLDMVDAASQSGSTNIALSPLNTLASLSDGLSDIGQDNFDIYAQGLYANLFARLSASNAPADDLFLSELTRFLAVIANQDDLRDDLAERAAQFIGFDGRPVNRDLPSALYGTAFSIAVETYGPEYFDALFDARSEIDDPRFAAAAAGALGATSDPSKVEEVRNLILTGTLGPRESYALLGRQLDNDETKDATWTWMIENYPEIIPQIPGTWPRRTPRLANSFCDTDKIPELVALFEEHGDLAPGYERALAETIESLTLCEAFRQETQGSIETALAARIE